MGLLSDTLEDNRERAAQLETRKYRPGKAPRKPAVKFLCPICDQVFASEVARHNHISGEHAKSHVYIKADRSVIRSSKVLPKTPLSLELIPHKIPHVQVTVDTAKTHKSFSTDRLTDLLPFVPANYIGEVRVSVRHDQVYQQFLIYIGVTPPFDQKRLDAEAVELQECLESGTEPDWAGFQERKRQLARNDLERQYLDGFLEYSIGFYMEKQSHWQESGRRLEAAMELLLAYDTDSEFSTSLARTALRVLSIRMNCFAPLKRCHPTSVFYRARSFFVDGAFKLKKDNAVIASPSGERVYVDGFTEQFLLAVKAFYARDFVTVVGLVESLTAHPIAEDKNNDDKLSLLKARTFREMRNREKACAAYERLRYHPLFGREAEEFLTSPSTK